MSDEEIYLGITETIRDVFMRDDLVATPELTAADVDGWDSFKQIEIVIATEERFGVKFTGKEIDGMKRVGDMARLVSAKLG